MRFYSGLITVPRMISSVKALLLLLPELGGEKRWREQNRVKICLKFPYKYIICNKIQLKYPEALYRITLPKDHSDVNIFIM